MIDQNSQISSKNSSPVDDNKMHTGLWVKITVIVTITVYLVFRILFGAALGGRIESKIFELQDEQIVGEEVSASKEVYFAQRGQYTIYVEYDRTVDSQALHEPFDLNTLKLQVIQLSDLAELPLAETAKHQYTIRRTVGIATAAVDIVRPGEHLINLVVTLEEPVDSISLSFRKNYKHRYLWAGVMILFITIVSSLVVWKLIQHGHPKANHLG